MKTILLIRASSAARRQFNTYTCSTIWAADRFAFTPSIPLAQNLHPTGHPTCELTHAVLLAPSGMMTVSAFFPSGQVSSSFVVPSVLFCCRVITQEVNSSRSWRAERSALEKLDISCGFVTSL